LDEKEVAEAITNGEQEEKASPFYSNAAA